MKKLYTFMAVIILILPAYAQQEAEQLLKAIVKVKSTIPNEARTAGVLGTTREGNGVLIDAEGHILTIGYLILEAGSIEVVDQEGQTIPAGSCSIPPCHAESSTRFPPACTAAQYPQPRAPGPSIPPWSRLRRPR